jgi:uncharacterized protein (DUF433 family)
MPVLDRVETIPLAMGADGVIRVARTRVTLETIVGAFQDGATAEEIAQQYLVVPLGDVYQVIGYYLHYTAEVTEYLSNSRQASENARLENERVRTPPASGPDCLPANAADGGAEPFTKDETLRW